MTPNKHPIRGNIKDASLALDNRVYFDQYGFISSKFGIRHIPCIVRQNGKMLEIREISYKKLGKSHEI